MSNTNLLTPTIKRKVQNRSSSGCSSDSPEEKRLKEFNEDEGDKVMRNAFKLKNTDFTIYDDIPKELIDLRKKRMTTYSESNKKCKVVLYEI